MKFPAVRSLADTFKTLDLEGLLESNLFIEKLHSVADVLKDTPSLRACEVATHAHLSRNELKTIYKLIQHSDTLQVYLKKSINRDYFNVVDDHFNHRIFVVVLFVGTYCPSRCYFCPSVNVLPDGQRLLSRYSPGLQKKMSSEDIESVFRDLEFLKNRGENILVKVSGGLEPLTDIKTIEHILNCATRIDVPVKLFTNGMLLDTEKRRDVALRMDDIRISLGVSDESNYAKVCFGSPHHRYTLARLRNNLLALVTKRNGKDLKCRIGLNSIVLEETYQQLEGLIRLATEVGLDYIDLKPDYFATYNEKTQTAIYDEVIRTREIATSMGDVFINVSSVLSSKNLFWRNWTEKCNPHKQSRYKIFVTPYGSLSPVHHGAFPHGNSEDTVYTIGRINKKISLLDILHAPQPIPDIDYKKLNPFELILALEIEREESDDRWGVPIDYSPYHTLNRSGHTFLRKRQ